MTKDIQALYIVHSLLEDKSPVEDFKPEDFQVIELLAKKTDVISRDQMYKELVRENNDLGGKEYFTDVFTKLEREDMLYLIQDNIKLTDKGLDWYTKVNMWIQNSSLHIDQIVDSLNFFINKSLEGTYKNTWDKKVLTQKLQDFFQNVNFLEINVSYHLDPDLGLLSKFFIWSKENNNEIYDYMCHYLIGYTLLKLKSLPDTSFSNISSTNFYLDTPLLISLMEIDGEESHTVIKNIIDFLRKETVIVKVFQHTIDELYHIYDVAKRSANHSLYYAGMASPFAQFLRNKRGDIYFNGELWLEQKIQDFTTKFGIQIDRNSYSKITPYDLAYRNELEDFFWSERNSEQRGSGKTSVDYDVESFSNIYKLCEYQAGKSYKKWKDIKACFVSDNSQFFEASLQIYNMNKDFTISAMVNLNHLLYLIYKNNKVALYENMNLTLLRYAGAYAKQSKISKEIFSNIISLEQNKDLEEYEDSIALSILNTNTLSIYITDSMHRAKSVIKSNVPTSNEFIANELDKITDIKSENNTLKNENNTLKSENDILFKSQKKSIDSTKNLNSDIQYLLEAPKIQTNYLLKIFFHACIPVGITFFLYIVFNNVDVVTLWIKTINEKLPDFINIELSIFSPFIIYIWSFSKIKKYYKKYCICIKKVKKIKLNSEAS